jgi:hypothetical protein
MLERYTRMAVTLADLDYQPFPDATGAIPELAEAARLHTRLHKPAVSEGRTEHSEDVVSAQNQSQCEGGDLNPYANYGASTSS